MIIEEHPDHNPKEPTDSWHTEILYRRGVCCKPPHKNAQKMLQIKPSKAISKSNPPLPPYIRMPPAADDPCRVTAEITRPHNPLSHSTLTPAKGDEPSLDMKGLTMPCGPGPNADSLHIRRLRLLDTIPPRSNPESSVLVSHVPPSRCRNTLFGSVMNVCLPT